MKLSIRQTKIKERNTLNISTKNFKEQDNWRDVDRLVRNDRIAFGSSMVACKDAMQWSMKHRHYAASIEKLKHVCDARKGEPIFGMTMMVLKEELF